MARTITANYGNERHTKTYTEADFRAHMATQVTWGVFGGVAAPQPGRLAAVDRVLSHVLDGEPCHPSSPGACICFGWTTYTTIEASA